MRVLQVRMWDVVGGTEGQGESEVCVERRAHTHTGRRMNPSGEAHAHLSFCSCSLLLELSFLQPWHFV